METERAEKYYGRKVRLQADHPEAGSHGTFVDVMDTPFGRRPVVELEEGRRVTVMEPEQWEPQQTPDTR